MGMLSLMDAILAVPIGMVIEELSLALTSRPVARAKTGKRRPFRRFTTLWWRAKPADWERVTHLGKQLSCRCRLCGNVE